MLRTPVAALLLLTVLWIGTGVWANRVRFTTGFDEAYWKERYEQSQWKIPMSDRTIGDDGLYLYEGYRLIRGDDPTTVNAEMPPLGKYLIGISIRLFGNGHIYGLALYTGTLFLTYLLTRTLTRHTAIALGATLLLAADPLFSGQQTLTMMDSLQAFLLTAYLLILVRAGAKPSARVAGSAGVLLGLFSGAKIALLAPVLCMAGLYVLFRGTDRIKSLMAFCAGILAGYALPYVPYFIRGHTLTEFLRLQKWIASFYLHSDLTPTWGSALTAVTGGWYRNIYSHAWVRTPEWSPLWLPALISSVFSFLIVRRHKDRTGVAALAAITAMSFTALTVIPFWVRYLVAILPLLYVCGAFILSRLPSRIFYPLLFLAFAVNAACALPLLFPGPETAARQIADELARRQFSDLYQNTDRATRNQMTRDEFVRFAVTALHDGEIEHLTVTAGSAPRTMNSQANLPVTVTYATRRLGTFTAHTVIPLVREDNRWNARWDWRILVPGLSDGGRLVTRVDQARRGSILGSDKKPLAEDADGYLVSVIPGRIGRDEDALMDVLVDAFDGRFPKDALRARLFVSTVPDLAVPLGSVPHEKTSPRVTALKRFPSVTLSPAFVRLSYPNNINDVGAVANTLYPECCSYLYDTSSYAGISGAELVRNALLTGNSGGTLTVQSRDGTVVKTLIRRDKRDGSDAQPPSRNE